MEPPMAIICKCRLLSDRDKGEVAVFRAAFSGSNTCPLAPMTPFGVTVSFESRVKLSKKR